MVEHVNSVVTRFWGYTDVKGVRDCWFWEGSLMVRGGYGQLNDRGRLLKAHRLSYEINIGAIPKGKFVCHKCNNPKCVNPRHLYVGTAQDNWNDVLKAGNNFRIPAMPGEKNPSAKLTWGQVKIIRESKLTGVELAKRYKVATACISSIKRRKTWKIK